jgi:predicted N-formylglutamate amidohydrolase
MKASPRASRAPYRILRRRLLTPLILTCEHASNTVPRQHRPSPEDRRLLGTHRGWDIGAWEVARVLSSMLRATAVGGRYSRLVADLNRAPGDPTLVLEGVDGCSIGFNERLTPRAVGKRVAACHAPYHSEIDRQVARRVFAGVRPILLSVHSFTPVLEGKRRDLDVGVLYSAHRDLAVGLSRSLKSRGFRVALNRPYSGLRGLIYAAARHGANYFIPYLEIEISQALIATRASARRIGARIAPAVSDLMRREARSRERRPTPGTSGR